MIEGFKIGDNLLFLHKGSRFRIKSFPKSSHYSNFDPLVEIEEDSTGYTYKILIRRLKTNFIKLNKLLEILI